MQSAKIGLVQIDVSNRSDKNLDRAIDGVDQCIRERVDFILLPEMWLTGFNYKEIKKQSPEESEQAIELLSEKARQSSICIIAGSIAEKQGKKIFNTSYVFGPGGALGKYRKSHLFSPMGEQEHLTGGDSMHTFNTRFGKIGIIICYEIRFPELARALALKGAKIIFVPAQFPRPRVNIWRTLLAARAIENQLYVAACNRVGEDKKNSYFGHSLVVDPIGSIILEAGEDESKSVCEVDMGAIEKVRSEIRVFGDRRPELYRKYGV